MGGWKKEGGGKLTNDTPQKKKKRKGFWTPPRTVRFPPSSGVSALFFLYKNPRQRRAEALLEGSNNFRESEFSGTFSSPPHVLHPPIPTAQMEKVEILGDYHWTENYYITSRHFPELIMSDVM